MRLIDADTLIEDYKKELEKVDFEKLSDNDKLAIATSAKALIDFTKRQPTAYDIDKVVGELEEKKDLHKRLVDYENKCGTITEKFQHIKAIEVLDETIEIVKQGVK